MSINYTMLFADALGFTIALAWNDAVSKLIHRLYPPDQTGSNTRATLMYALIITVMVVIIVAIYNHTRQAMAGFLDMPAIGASAPDSDSVVRLWEPPQSRVLR